MNNREIITPHIRPEGIDIAKTVLMPGDPKRSEFVAKNFLEGAVLFNDIRGIKGYTGMYKGKPVSVMASGMGIPSICIYSYELYNFFGVNNIIRIGSAGSISESISLNSIVIAQGACTNSNFAQNYHLPGTFAPIASYHLLESSVQICRSMGMNYHVGNVLSSDTFYDDSPSDTLSWSKMGVLAIDMETAGLYMNAARAGKNALTLLTISDCILTHEKLSPNERETSFTDMITAALETSKNI